MITVESINIPAYGNKAHFFGGVFMAGRQKPKLRPEIKMAGLICLYCLFMGGFSYGVFYGYRYLHVSPYFSIKNIVCEGTSVRTEPAIRRIFSDVRGQNLLNLDLRPYQELALKHQWIASIELHRDLPATLHIKLVEREVAGVCQYKGQVHLFDHDGMIIDDLQGGQILVDTPVLRGIREESLREDLLFGFRFITDLKAESQLFWENMEELDIKNRENIIAYSSLIHAPVFLGRTPEPGNLSRFLSIIPFINKNYPELEYVELGVPHQVVIMPRAGSW